MPGALDAEIVAEAIAVLDELGKEITWRAWTRDGTQYDPATGDQPGTSVDHAIVASPPIDYRLHYVGGKLVNSVDGLTIKAGDAKVFIAAGAISFAPKAGDEAIIDAITWACVGVSPFYSGRLVALYEAQLRRRG